MTEFPLDTNKNSKIQISLEIDQGDEVSVLIQCFAPQKDEIVKEGFSWRPSGAPIHLHHDPSRDKKQWTISRDVIQASLQDVSYPFKFVCAVRGGSNDKKRFTYYAKLADEDYIVTGEGHPSEDLPLASTQLKKNYWYIWFLDKNINKHADIRNLWEVNQSLVDFGELVPNGNPKALDKWLNEAYDEVVSSPLGTRPKINENNIWFVKREGSTVFVFVHGFMSDCRKAWAYESSCAGQYWPQLVKTDPKIGDSSIFLGGYYSYHDSGDALDFEAVAKSLFDELSRESHSGHAVLNYENIIFVAHSAGGIVVREMLASNKEAFEKKRIGLLLVASPTRGSSIANFGPLRFLLQRNALARELRRNNQYLLDLDQRFKKFLDERRCPDSSSSKIYGRELCEHHHVSKFLRFLHWKPIVPNESAISGYFGEHDHKIVQDSDHYSIAKPTNEESEAHVKLYELYKEVLKND